MNHNTYEIDKAMDEIKEEMIKDLYESLSKANLSEQSDFKSLITSVNFS